MNQGIAPEPKNGRLGDTLGAWRYHIFLCERVLDTPVFPALDESRLWMHGGYHKTFERALRVVIFTDSKPLRAIHITRITIGLILKRKVEGCNHIIPSRSHAVRLVQPGTCRCPQSNFHLASMGRYRCCAANAELVVEA